MRFFKFIYKRQFLFLLLCCLALATSLSLIVFKQFPAAVKQKKLSFSNPANQQVYDKWFDKISRIGGQKAYVQFKAETEKKSVKGRHNDAHLFGEALYQIEGLNGVSVCDTSFSYGCYHSFLGSAIYSEGLGAVSILSEKCFDSLNKDGLACQHGIGHGVLSSVGYDLEAVNKSIQVCDQLKDKDPIGGCAGGVFMEYNFQTMLLDDGKVRQFNAIDPYFPCFSIDKNYSAACLYQQAQWWLSSIQIPQEKKTEQIDSLCSKLSDGHLKTQCYKGFGINLIAYINYDLAQAKKICQALKSPEAEAICRSGVAISLLAIPDLKDQGRQFCKSSTLSPDNQQLCLKNLDQIATSPTKND